jgi:threonine dehydrogenase-like Zn-dependent dehydrogenase
VLGHESLGRVIDPGPSSSLKKGDLVVGIVRRPDPVPCPNCAVSEWDMCRNGQYGGVITSAACADIAAATVLKNNVIVGSVNANKRHWYRAGEFLARADRSWLARLITRRVRPENFKHALERKPDDIKVVVQFSEV